MNVQLGCMPRAWSKFSADEALAGISAAGFKYYGALGHKELQIDGTTSPEQADAWHAAGLANGGKTCENPPGLREGSAGKLYLAYLRDLDGNKICEMHRIPS